MHCIKQLIKNGPVNKNRVEHLFFKIHASSPSVLSFDAGHRSSCLSYHIENSSLLWSEALERMDISQSSFRMSFHFSTDRTSLAVWEEKPVEGEPNKRLVLTRGKTGRLIIFLDIFKLK